MYKILLTPRAFHTYGMEILNSEKFKNFNFVINDTGKQYDAKTFAKLASDVDGIIVSVDRIDKNLLENCHKLKAIVKFGTGLDNVDLISAKEKNISVSNTKGSNAQSVAELTLGLILASSRHIVSSSLQVKKGLWNKPTGIEVKDKTVGIIGFGTIGQKVAKLLSPFNVKVLVYDVYDVPKEVLNQYSSTQVDFNTVLQCSDIITIHVPLTPQTENLIGYQQICMMKSSSILVNMSRGGIVNENHLLMALKDKKIYSAASDVFSHEPPLAIDVEQELLARDDFILTPHIGSRTVESEINTIHQSLEEIEALLTHHCSPT